MPRSQKMVESYFDREAAESVVGTDEEDEEEISSLVVRSGASGSGGGVKRKTPPTQSTCKIVGKEKTPKRKPANEAGFDMGLPLPEEEDKILFKTRIGEVFITYLLFLKINI
jgi:hypothetical protein